MIIRNCLIIFILMFGFYAFGISLNGYQKAGPATLNKNKVLTHEQQLQNVLNKTNDLSQYKMEATELEWN